MGSCFAGIEQALVVGSGLSGSALASTLENEGVEVRLLEKRLLSNDAEGAGVLLTANAMKVLDQLGFGVQVREKARSTDEIAMFDEHGELLYTVSCKDCGCGTPFVTIRHSILLDILRGGLKRSPQFGTTVSSISNAMNGMVEFDDGSVGNFDLVVAADGVRSNIRAMLYGDFGADLFHSYTGYRFITRCPGTIRHPQHYLGNGLTMLMYPLPDGELYCGAGPISRAALEERDNPISTIQSTFRQFPEPVTEVLAGLDQSTSIIPSTFWSANLPDWHRGRCLLIGDAAHAMPPTLSQGAAMAFEDVQVLVECLSQSTSLDSRLNTFVKRRRSRIDPLREESVSRLHANRRSSDRSRKLALQIYSQLGKSSLESVWSYLAKEAP